MILRLTFLVACAATLVSCTTTTTTRTVTSTCPKTSNLLAMYWPAFGGANPALVRYGSADLLFYVAAVTTPTGIQINAPQTLPDMQQFVNRAHSAGKAAILTVGGWQGCVYFSSLIATPASRARFAQTLLAFITQYNFDGIDIDWEYIGRQGAGNNIVSPQDEEHFLAFLPILRRTVGTKTLLHLSASAAGFIGASGQTIANYGPGYASNLNFVTVMAYDYFASGYSPTTGPNAPLNICNSGSSSLKVAVAYWIKAGVPACQILLGVPTYSHLFQTKSNSLTTTTYNGQHTLMFQTLSASQPVDPTTTYTGLIANGWLSADGLKGMGGWTRHFDNCTGSPLLFNSANSNFIAYDDQVSIGLKAQYARSIGLAGINMYSSQGANGAVFSAARQGLAGTFSPTAAQTMSRKRSKRQMHGDELAH